jgi:hypothetical protein
LTATIGVFDRVKVLALFMAIRASDIQFIAYAAAIEFEHY